MKILVVSQYFYPENFRINDLVLELKKRGHDITVFTGKPNYPKGKYYDGYTFKGNEDEIWNDIPIHRVPLRERKTGSINLIRNYISFVYHGNKGIKRLYDMEYDIIYVFETSPITVALPAIKLKKRKNIPIIMNVQDLWPENVIAITGVNNSVINYFLNKLVDYIYRNVDLILGASPAFVERILLRGKNENKVIYWPQYSVVSKEYDKTTRMFSKDTTNIVFTGNIGEAQGLEIVIEACQQLRDTNVVFHIVGDGRNRIKLENEVRDNHLEDKIIFYGHVQESMIPSYLKEADAALLILKSNPVFEMTIPAKLQTYLACGCPIIGCVEGISKNIIEESRSGILCKTVDADSLVIACKDFMNQTVEQIDCFGENALKYSTEHFNKEILIDKLINYMEELK